ncbi:DUF1801 domain-containing protein [Kineococcus rubinsiae]|uniref:DUF1801 domain-containing protein n=1 Tax=Kineococcus rubinsiae TaxID=2609562 RepID=UPI0014322E0D|nr:DUF1801 domain-containing protein [Kineococcus rubinsiae]NIZ92796.1 DUF1801 domain-containing protein [Kineococcus rubinsiae]
MNAADSTATASENIDALIAQHPDWRGETLAQCRRAILDADPGVVEEWKYMGAPVWSLDGMLIAGGVFSRKVKLGFLWGASLPDPQHLFNGELGGKQRRSVEFAEGDAVPVEGLQELVRAAIRHNAEKPAKRAAAKKAASGNP